MARFRARIVGEAGMVEAKEVRQSLGMQLWPES
jgi:hypothetical protein